MKVRILPHRTALDGVVAWDPWWAELGGQRVELTDRLKGWDYESEVAFELQPSFDEQALLESTGLDSFEQIAVVLLLDCPAAGHRWSEAYLVSEMLATDAGLINISPPIGEFASEIFLSAHLVLWERREAEDGSATRPGSRLLESKPQRVRLEGDGARFPTEEISFAALGLEAAAWSLRAVFDDLGDPFMSTVRLLINKDHPGADVLLDSSNPAFDLAQSALRTDIARQLVARVAQEAHLMPEGGDEWPEGSVGATLTELTGTFLRMDLKAAAQLARSDVSRFERKLQEGFEFLGVSGQ